MKVETITLDNKKYVIMEEDAFIELQSRAIIHKGAQKKYSLEEAKQIGFKLIDKWHTERLVSAEK